jgi:hypothetical protein
VDVSEASDPTPLKGQLKGLKLYVMHCKAPMEKAMGIECGKLARHITSELRGLVEEEGLGLDVIAVEQGMRICELSQHPRRYKLTFIQLSKDIISLSFTPRFLRTPLTHAS